MDVTIEAQKIMSCVARIAQRNKSFGKTMVVNILHGSKNEKIKQWGLNSLSTYGIMADMPVRKIRTILDFLLQKDYLMLSQGEYPVVRLGENWEEIIRGNKQVEMKLPKETKPDKQPQSQPLYDVDQDLFDALKGLRSRLASKAHVPAYIIFSDAALKDMCRKLPRTNEEFLNVSGVGQTKMERYGNLFTELINSYISQKSHEPHEHHSK